MHLFRVCLSLVGISLFAGCAGLEQLDRTLHEVVPTHPVTGAPVANVVSEQDEVRTAAGFHARIVEAAGQQGLSLDPPGPHLEQMKRVIARLGPVAGAHRPTLPWQWWLIPDPTSNAFTTGGGYVYFFEGIWGPQGLIREGDDDELAFVLAHEMAHVNLLHVSQTRTQAKFNRRVREDPFYSASFTTEQEAEADRLAVFYTTLAGYDPEAGARTWDRTGVTEADTGYRNSHPVGADRARRVREAVAQVRQHRMPGRVNPAWQRLLVSNPLFPRAASGDGSQPGSGIVRAIQLGLETKLEHQAAKDEAERREEAAWQLPENQVGLVKLLAVQAGTGANGQPLVNCKR